MTAGFCHDPFSEVPVYDTLDNTKVDVADITHTFLSSCQALIYIYIYICDVQYIYIYY